MHDGNRVGLASRIDDDLVDGLEAGDLALVVGNTHDAILRGGANNEGIVLGRVTDQVHHRAGDCHRRQVPANF